MGYFKIIKGSLKNAFGFKKEQVVKDLKTRQEETKQRLFTSIEQECIAQELFLYLTNKTVFEHRNQRGREKRIIDQQLRFFKKELQEVFTDNDIFILTQQLYQKAELRCLFGEMKGALPKNKFEKLYELECQTSTDRGQQFKKACRRLGFIGLEKPLQVRLNTDKRTGRLVMPGDRQQQASETATSKSVTREKNTHCR